MTTGGEEPGDREPGRAGRLEHHFQPGTRRGPGQRPGLYRQQRLPRRHTPGRASFCPAPSRTRTVCSDAIPRSIPVSRRTGTCRSRSPAHSWLPGRQMVIYLVRDWRAEPEYACGDAGRALARSRAGKAPDDLPLANGFAHCRAVTCVRHTPTVSPAAGKPDWQEGSYAPRAGYPRLGPSYAARRCRTRPTVAAALTGFPAAPAGRLYLCADRLSRCAGRTAVPVFFTSRRQWGGRWCHVVLDERGEQAAGDRAVAFQPVQ